MKILRMAFVVAVVTASPMCAITDSMVYALGSAGGTITTGLCGVATVGLLDQNRIKSAIVCGGAFLGNALATAGALKAYQKSNNKTLYALGTAGGLAGVAFFGKASLKDKISMGPALCSLLATIANIQAYRSSGGTITDSVSTEKHAQGAQ